MDVELWTLDQDLYRIYGPKGWVSLTPLEWRLMSYFIGAEGRILSRDELFKKVWGNNFPAKHTRTIDHFIGRMRKKFEKDIENPKHLIGHRGFGIRFKR